MASATESPPDDAAAIGEVEALHEFFAAWFRGMLPNDAAGFAPLEAALAPGFLIVSPRGTTATRAETIAGLRRAHGIWAPADTIEIVNARVVRRDRSVVVAMYEEWQQRGAERTGRVSTALFDAELRWLHVHETWLPTASEPATG